MFSPAFSSSFYGSNTIWFVGVVEDTNDPIPRLRRVRVRIKGLHTNSKQDISTADLPWSQVMVPSTSPGISGYGASPNLQVGASVFGIFLDGETKQLPLVLGSIHTIEGENVVNSAGQKVSRQNSTSVDRRGLPTLENVASKGSTNQEIAWNYFTGDAGWPKVPAAAIIGNLMKESGQNLNTGSVNPNDGADGSNSIGLAQWNDYRAKNLRAFADKSGVSYLDLMLQLQFVNWELSPEGSHAKVGAHLRTLTDITEAGLYVNRRYEVSADSYANGRLQIRLQYCFDVLQRYG